jgi:hypothetical protein
MGRVAKWVKRGILPLLSKVMDRLPITDVSALVSGLTARKQFTLFSPEYPFDSRPRWDTKRPHPEIAARLAREDEKYRRLLESWRQYVPKLQEIPYETSEPGVPYWKRSWTPSLDGVSIYCFLASQKPAQFLEVGSGHSTKFARRAIRDFGLATRLTSIDPAPRAEIDLICDNVIRKGLEEADLSAFGTLKPDDIVYVDNSHRSLMNSDVTTFFLDALPKIPKGVLIGIHDIFWPEDYPPEWADRYYSEQYLLAMLILWNPSLEIVLPAYYVSSAAAGIAKEALEPFWKTLPADVQRHGGAFWFRWNG